MVQVQGKLEIPPEQSDFSYRDYLARQGVYTWAPYASIIRTGSGQGSPLKAAIYTFRDRLKTSLLRLFPAPESSLLVGILLGDDNLLPDSLMQAF